MKRVITVSLNEIAYQVDEEGYSTLRRYIDRAEARLKTNPDQAEIMRDLEQSIGERLGNCLSSNKTVVNKDEVDSVLKDVGIVEPGEGEYSEPKTQFTPGRRRLFRIREGQKIAGECQGLAAYADLNVDLVRLIFVLLAIFSGGIFALVYLIMMFVVPVAYTPEQRAAAHASAAHVL